MMVVGRRRPLRLLLGAVSLLLIAAVLYGSSSSSGDGDGFAGFLPGRSHGPPPGRYTEEELAILQYSGPDPAWKGQ